MDRYSYKGSLPRNGQKRVSGTSQKEARSFPNYLRKENKNSPAGSRQQRSQQPSSFVADNMRQSAPAVPFLQQSHNKETFQQHQEHQKEQPAPNHFAEGKRRFEEEKRGDAAQERHPYSLYKSRRPFRATEIPSLWNKLPERENKKIDYQKIKEELFVPDEELILCESDRPGDLRGAEKITQSASSAAKTKKALNRSLRGIMEQEKSYPAGNGSTTRPPSSFRPGSPPYSGYFS